MMIWMSLQLVKQVIWDSMRGVPRMSNRNFLIFPIFFLLSSQSVMLNIIDCFKISDSTKRSNQIKDKSLSPIYSPNKSRKDKSWNNTKNCTVQINRFFSLYFHSVNTFIWTQKASFHKLIHVDSFLCTCRILWSSDSFMMTPNMLISEMHIK